MEKLFVPLVRSFTLNELSKIESSLIFPNDIIQQNLGLFKASVDNESLFTKNLLDETINICIELLFKEGH